MFSTSEIPKPDDKMKPPPTVKGQLIVVADAASPQAQSVIEALLRHNCESKQLFRNRVAARHLAEQQAAQKAASEEARAQATAASSSTTAEGASATNNKDGDKDGDKDKDKVKDGDKGKDNDENKGADKDNDEKDTKPPSTPPSKTNRTDKDAEDDKVESDKATDKDSGPVKTDDEAKDSADAEQEPPTTPVKGGSASDKKTSVADGKNGADNAITAVATGLVGTSSGTGSDETVKTPPSKKTAATSSADLSPSALGKATAAAIASETCAIADDTPPSTPSQKQKEQSDEEAALAAFPLHTQSSAVRFTENLPPSLSSPLKLHLTSNVPNDSTTSTVLVDSEGIVRPVGIQPITNNIFESIKGSRSQSFSRFKDDPPENAKTVRSNSAPNAATTSSSLGRDEPGKDKNSPGTSTATSTSNSNSTSNTSTAANSANNSKNSSTDSTFNIPAPKSKDGTSATQPVDENKKEQLAQEARLRAAFKFQGNVEDTVEREYIQPWTVHAVFSHETPDEVMYAYQKKMYDMIKASFNDEQTMPVMKADFSDESAVDEALRGANGVFVALFDKRGLPWDDMATPGRLFVDAAHRAGADHFIACCIADLECHSQLPLPKSIADGRAIREYLNFQSADGEQIVEISTPLSCHTPTRPSTPTTAQPPPTTKEEKAAAAVAAALAKSTYFKHCTTLSIAVPFEAFLSEKVFHFVKQPGSGYLLETHVPVTEWFPFSSLRDVGPFALQSFLVPDARESHHLSLVSDFTCLQQATGQAAQIIYHSHHKIQCPDNRDLTVGMFLGNDEVRDWYVKEGLDEVYHLLAWWITSKASDAFWRSGAAFPVRNKLSAWRHYIYAEVDSVLPGWKDPESQWHSKSSASTNSYQFNQEPSMFSSRYATVTTKTYSGRSGGIGGGSGKLMAKREDETPRDEVSQLDLS